LSNTFLQSK
jgi:hypothetical protein